MELELKHLAEEESKSSYDVSDVDSEGELLSRERNGGHYGPRVDFKGRMKSTLRRLGLGGKGEKDSGDKIRLKKELTLFPAVAYVVGAIIGSGIFITPKTILCLTGSFGLSLVVWVIGGVIAAAGGLCYVELGLLIRKSGGEYSYLKEAYSFRNKHRVFEVLGSLLSFLFVWASMLIIRPSSLALITLTCARYLVRPFYVDCDAISESAVKLLAVSILIILAITNCYSLKLASKLMSILTTSKILVVLFIVIVGVIFMIKQETFPESFTHPFLPARETNVPSITLSLYGVLFAYNGWNIMGYANEETRNVKRTLPLSLLIGVPIVAASYLLVNVSFFAILTYDQILSAQAVALPFGKATLGTAGLIVIPLLVSVSTFGAANGSLLAATRALFVAAREGHLPDCISGLHVTAKTPVPAIILQVSLAMLMAVIGTIDQLIQASSFVNLIVYILVFIGVLILRVTHRHEPRLFKSWFIVPVTVCLVLLCVFLVFGPLLVSVVPPLIALGFMLLGIPVYFFLAMNSPWKLRPKIMDTFSEHVAVFVNNILNTQSTRESIPQAENQ